MQIWKASSGGTAGYERYVFEVSVERKGKGRVVVVRNAAVELALSGWQEDNTGSSVRQGEAISTLHSRL